MISDWSKIVRRYLRTWYRLVLYVPCTGQSWSGVCAFGRRDVEYMLSSVHPRIFVEWCVLDRHEKGLPRGRRDARRTRRLRDLSKRSMYSFENSYISILLMTVSYVVNHFFAFFVLQYIKLIENDLTSNPIQNPIRKDTNEFILFFSDRCDILWVNFFARDYLLLVPKNFHFFSIFVDNNIVFSSRARSLSLLTKKVKWIINDLSFSSTSIFQLKVIIASRASCLISHIIRSFYYILLQTIYLIKKQYRIFYWDMK